MGNEFNIFDNFYNDLNKEYQDLILNFYEIYKPNNKILKQQVKKHVNNVGQEIKTKDYIFDKTNANNEFDSERNSIKDVKPFDIAIAVANAKAKQEQDNIVTLYTSKLTTHINNIIKKMSLDGYRFCVVNIYDVLDKKFDELDTYKQVKIIGNVANKFRKCGYRIFASLLSELSENDIMKKRTIKVGW